MCRSFEKGFSYYFHLLWGALKRCNFIDQMDLNGIPDLRIGLYYVADCWHLDLVQTEIGTWRIFCLQDKESGARLKTDDILAREPDTERVLYHYNNFKAGILPELKPESEKEPEIKEFGWLSPTGVFTESPFCTHEEAAEKIIRKNGFSSDYRAWKKARRREGLCLLARDFLADEKGYALIHNPSGYHGYLVMNTKPLTKAQREFLYGYFSDMGDRLKAESFLES